MKIDTVFVPSNYFLTTKLKKQITPLLTKTGRYSVSILLCATLLFGLGGGVTLAQDAGGDDNSTTDLPKRKDSKKDVTQREPEAPIHGPKPKKIETTYELSEDGKGYYVHEQVNGKDVRPPTYITMEEMKKIRQDEQREKFFKDRSRSASGGGAGRRPVIKIPGKAFETIFGSNKIDIKPNIGVMLDFSVRVNKMKNPSLSIKQQKNTSFNFDQQIQMDVKGQIGDKLKLGLNYDTESQFQFDNKINLNYEGKEDDLLKQVQAGNVSMPLKGVLITGGQNLWGIKVGTQWGPVYLTTLMSQQRGKTSEVTVSGGAQETTFEKKASDYDHNRHFFLNHYFRSIYENSLARLPIINSPININRVEVWVTNRSASSTNSTRNAIGFVDLAENTTTNGGVFYNPAIANGVTASQPDNNANPLYAAVVADPDIREKSTSAGGLNKLGYVSGDDYEMVENMKLLSTNEYTFHPQLGYISLNSRLANNDVLYVAYEYTIAGSNKIYKVGEFSADKPSNQSNTNILFLKMLKPSSIRPGPTANNPTLPAYPTWDLMMKNVYNIGGYNLRADGFNLEIKYESTDGKGDIIFFPGDEPNLQNKPLIQVFGVDKLTNNSESGPDNKFDFINGATVIPNKGNIIFPSLEPFGKYMIDQFSKNPDQSTELYAYEELYKFSQTDATKYYPQVDRFKFTGKYQGESSNEIYLNAINVTEGSVKVTAGGTLLTEGMDYNVDYMVGKVSITNPGILTSGQEIKVTFESNTLFGIQQKSLLGARVDFKKWKNIQLGGTVMYLNEKPLINKIRLGSEPVSNVIYGVDMQVRQKSGFVTDILNKFPTLNSKVKSDISLTTEFAHLLPGTPKAIDDIAYLDDFEGAKSVIDLSGIMFWKLASVPPDVSTPSSTDPKKDGFTRAKLAWYAIDPLFFDRPDNFGLDEKSPSLNNHYTRRVQPKEVFPNKTQVVGANILSTFDMHYIPNERGPYNFQADPAKLNADGTFNTPRENWAGLMRRTTGNTDFEAANFEYIEFWMMDPFMDNPSHTGGEFYINLGKVSEDILSDNGRSFENGIPADGNTTYMTNTPWGRVSDIQVQTNAFDNDKNAREIQDVGLDGLSNTDEKEFYKSFLDALALAGLGQGAIDQLYADPSTDDYNHFQYKKENGSLSEYPSGTDILTRYRDYNGTEGNSPINDASDNITTQATPNPDAEDINADGTLNTIEKYWSYKMKITPSEMQIGRNYIVDQRSETVSLPNKTTTTSNWYLFRVPIRQGKRVNGIQDFKAIDFIRMYMTKFDEEIIIRLGKFQLVSTQWRVYNGDLGTGDEILIPEPGEDETNFQVGTLNIEENGTKKPFNYVIPPGIERQSQIGTLQGLLQNEQAFVMTACNLKDGDARAIFKTVDFDFRNYEEFKLWVHSEESAISQTPNVNQCGDVELFVRFGSDYTNNYYEYTKPLCPSDKNGGANDQENVWRDLLNLNIQNMQTVKSARNNEQRQGRIGFDEVYTGQDALSDIAIKGNPQLNHVKTIMVGVRNPKNDGAPVCAEVWINEMMLTGFNKRQAWAMNGRLNMKLADVANVSLSGAMQTPGFGGVEQKINERSLEGMKRYDVAASMQVGKLLPKGVNIEIPAYFTYGNSVITPLYSPLDPDIYVKSALEAIPNAAEKQAFIDQNTSVVNNISYSLNNVRKLPSDPKRKKRIWDISNFAGTYGYSKMEEHNATIELHKIEKYNAGLSYNYSFSTKPVKPFKGSAPKQNLIRSFNFYYLPKTIALRIEGDKLLEEQRLRSLGEEYKMDPTLTQNFRLNRTYSVQWSLTQSLALTYQASNQSRVDQPKYGQPEFDEAGDVFGNKYTDNNFLHFGKSNASPLDSGIYRKYHLINFGRTTNFSQQFNARYQVPFNLFKPLNWLRSSLNYSGNYGWQSAALQNVALGNVINNSRTIQGNGRLDMAKLYKKWPAIDKMLSPEKKDNIITRTTDSTYTNYSIWRDIGKTIGRIAFSIKSIDGNYSANQTTTLPGYMPRSDNFGVDIGYSGYDGNIFSPTDAPGWAFVFGHQPDLIQGGWLRQAGDNGWIATDPAFTTPFSNTDSRQLTGKTAVTLFEGFRVNLNVNKQTTKSSTGLFALDQTTNNYDFSNQSLTGSHNISYLPIFTSFKDHKDLFADFDNNRRTLSRRIANTISGYADADNPGQVKTPDNLSSNGFYNGYTGSSQDVLIPAFLATYGRGKPEKIKMSPFPSIPLPNWSVSYNGLSDIGFLRDHFKTVTLKHAYTSSYSNSYLLNLNGLDTDGNGFSDSLAYITQGTMLGSNSTNTFDVYNFEPQYRIQSVVITESFSPLVGINFVWKNGITTNVDYKRSRNLMLNIGSMQLTETKNSDISINTSYRSDKLMNSIRLFKKDISLKNTVTYRFEVTVRNQKSENRRLDFDRPSQPTAGNFNLIIKPSIDYMINTQLTVRIYLEINKNTPALSTSFPTSYTAGGIQVQFRI